VPHVQNISTVFVVTLLAFRDDYRPRYGRSSASVREQRVFRTRRAAEGQATRWKLEHILSVLDELNERALLDGDEEEHRTCTSELHNWQDKAAEYERLCSPEAAVFDTDRETVLRGQANRAFATHCIGEYVPETHAVSVSEKELE